MTIGFGLNFRVARGLRAALALGTAPLALAVATSAYAQGPAQSPANTAGQGSASASHPATADSAPAAPAAVLQEIVITAQRRSESLQKAAVAVAVISPTQLVNAGVV